MKQQQSTLLLDANTYLDQFNYRLPEELVAQEPVEPRDHSRLLVVDRNTGEFEDRKFFELAELLNENDVLVVNDSRVFAARILGKKPTGGKAELLLVKDLGRERWLAMGFSRMKAGSEIIVNIRDKEVRVVVEERRQQDGMYVVRMPEKINVDEIGVVPLPPYISSRLSEKERRSRYQTVYAKEQGSAAAPTAGMHFTQELLDRIGDKGVEVLRITLHVGPGTFAKVREEQLREGRLHREEFGIGEETATKLEQAIREGKRVVAVGTTSVRALESAWGGEKFRVGWQETELFIRPPHKFEVVGAMITNFHVPRSSLLMLVSAFGCVPNGKDMFEDFGSCVVGKAYQHAVAKQYRFFSFGDAMFIC